MLLFASGTTIFMIATGLALACYGIIYIFIHRIYFGFFGLQWIFMGALAPWTSLWVKLVWMIPGIILLAADAADKLPKIGWKWYGRIRNKLSSHFDD